jgi:hypothetical protein
MHDGRPEEQIHRHFRASSASTPRRVYFTIWRNFVLMNQAAGLDRAEPRPKLPRRERRVSLKMGKAPRQTFM